MRLLITVCVFAVAAGATAEIEHTILHGVSVASVRVGIGPDQLRDLPEEQLQAHVVSRLREAGIQMVPGAPAILQIAATVVLDDSSSCFAQLDARLLEEARLERNGHRVHASSWGDSAVVSGPPADCTRGVIRAVESAVDNFIEHYQAMNPER